MAGAILFEIADFNDENHWLSVTKRNLRDAQNPFELPDREFMGNFRLNKNGAQYLIETLAPYFGVARRNTKIEPMVTILCTLQFLSNGSYQKVIGNNIITPMSQTMVCHSLDIVLNLIITELAPRWIKFPRNQVEMEPLKNRFHELGMPDVVGIVDGTHISIVKPHQNEEMYINRKNYHSLNVQVVCDRDLNILSVNARYPGRCPDGYVWRNSLVFSTMRNNYVQGAPDNYILGDSGYPLQPWLLIPVRNPPPNTLKVLYNGRFLQIRSRVERCIGVAKARFRCLLKDGTLHYTPLTASKIVISCAILHNIAQHYNRGEHIEPILEDNMNDVLPNNINFDYRRAGELTRQQYINRHF